MPRNCSICSHPARKAIERSLIGGEPFRHIAARTGTSTAALQRHKQGHLPKSLAKAKQVREVARDDSLLDRLRDLNRETQEVLRAAAEEKNHELRLKAISRVEKQLELEARLIGELKQGGPAQINLMVITPAILGALDPFPQARQAVARRLQELEAETVLPAPTAPGGELRSLCQ